MVGAEESVHDVAMMSLLVGGLTGQYELSEQDRQGVGEWLVDHSDIPEVRDLLIKIVRTQIMETSEFRVKVAEAIRGRFQQADDDTG